MTERLSDIAARIGTVEQLSAVITAMRGIAAARSREAERHLAGIRSYAQTVADAIGEGLAFLPSAERTGPLHHAAGGLAIVALCSEQGFVGTFNERVLDAVAPLLKSPADNRSDLILIGDRGLMLAQERGYAVSWSVPMIAHVGQAASLASRIVDELYRRLEAEETTRVVVVHAAPGETFPSPIASKVLVPFDFSRFPVPQSAVVPLVTLPPQVLVARLAEEYIFAELCEAVMLSYAAENEARMRAMIAAKSNVGKTLDGLHARFRQLRQEEITSEIVELAGGARGMLDAELEP